MTLDLRLKAYAPNGASHGQLPAPDSFSLAVPLNDTPSLTLNYGVVGARADLLGQPVELAVEVSGDGGATWSEPDDCRFIYVRDGRDPIKTADTYAVEAPGYIWRLGKARVLDEGLATEEGRRVFQDVTPGAIVTTLWDEAQARGALDGMSLSGSEALDAAGVAWGTTLTRDYELGADYLTVLRELAETGWLDFRMSGRTLKVWKPDTALATDRTVGGSQVTLTPMHVTEAPFRRTWEGLADFLRVQGDAGAYVDMTNPGALAPWGRWEDYTTQGGVTDTGTLTALGERYQTLTEGVRAEYTQGLALGGDAPRPFLDFFAGDFIWSRSLSGAPVRYRVRQVTLQKEGTTVQGNVVLNDRFLEEDIRTQRALTAITGGATSGGSTGGTVTPPGSDILRPAAPAAPSASSAAYAGPAGLPQAQITLDWPDVTTNIDGTPITDLAGYEIQERPDGGVWSVRTRIGTDSAITMSPFTPDSSWSFRLRAFDTAGNESPLSGITTIVAALDDDPPDAPSTPSATSFQGTVDVTWDGENSIGNPQADADLDRVELHASTVNGFTPTVNNSATKVGNYYGPGTMTITGLAIGSRQYLRLVAVDTSGNGAVGAQTFVDVAALTDGLPPVAPTPWTPTLTPLGIMGLVANWPEVPNADAVMYDVYLGTATVSDPPDAGDYVGSTAGTFMAIDRLPGSGDAFISEQEYACRIVARDADGESGASDEVTAYVRQATNGDIAAEYVYANRVEANQIVSGSLEASLAILADIRTAATGRNIALSTADGLRAQDQDLNTLFHVPTDPTLDLLANLHLIAKSVTALGPVALRSADNEIAANAAMILRAGTTAPVTPPTVQQVWTEQRFDVAANDANAPWYRGMDIDSGEAYQAFTIYGGPSGVDTRNATTGALISSWEMPEGWVLFGVVRVGAYLYVLGADDSRLAVTTPRHFVRKYDLAGVYQGVEWEPNTGTPAPYGDPAIGVDRANSRIIVARMNNTTLYIKHFDTAGALITNRSGAFGSSSPNLGSVSYGSFDLGATKYVLSTMGRLGGDLILVADNDASVARNSNLEWPVAYADQTGGMAWDAAVSQFRQASWTRTTWYAYDGNYWAGAATKSTGVASTWYDSDATGGTHETVMGPVATFALKKRARVSVTTPPIPTDPNAANHDDPVAIRVYSADLSVPTTYFRQASPADGVTTVILPLLVFSNADTLHPPPPVVGDFPNGTPGFIQAEDISYRFDGDGDMSVRDLAIDGDLAMGGADADGQRISFLDTGAGRLGPYQWGATAAANPPIGTTYSATGNHVTSIANAAITVLGAGWTGGEAIGVGSGKYFSAYSNGVWTMAVAGEFDVNASVSFGDNAVGRRVALIYVNGVARRRADTGSGGLCTVGVTHKMALAVGDTIEIRCYQNRGGNLLLDGASVPHWFQIERRR